MHVKRVRTGDIGRTDGGLYVSLRDYVVRALDLLGDAFRSRPSGFGVLDMPVWHRDEDGLFRQTGTEVVWSSALDEELENFPEYATAVEALRSDPDASAHLDVLVGTIRGGMAFQTSSFLRSLITSSFHASSPFAFRADLFDARYHDFVDWVRSDVVESLTVVPLAGVGGDCSTPVRLGGTVELDRLTELELTRALSVGAIRPMGGMPIYANEPPAWALRIRRPEPKLVGEDAFGRPDTQNELMQSEELVSREIERALTVLRVHKPGRFTPSARLTFAGGPGPGQGTSFSLLSTDFHGFVAYALSDSDREALQVLAEQTESPGVRQRPYVGNALRRFLFAGDRRRSDDRLLDLMIAAESLFLGHLKEREGELRFRLSLHTAHLLGRDSRTRRMIARQMRLAYDTRSAIVHGGTPSPAKWGSTSAHPTSLEEFTDGIEGLMREALKRAVGLCAGDADSTPFFDWEGAILGDPAGP